MSLIRSGNTKPERALQSMLRNSGERFDIRRDDLSGKPDIVFSRHRIAIFVHGCFWHRHSGCRAASMPRTRRKFWTAKLQGNCRRDARNCRQLRRLGWGVLIVWQCVLRKSPQTVLARILKRLGKIPSSGEEGFPPSSKRQSGPKSIAITCKAKTRI